MQDEEIGLPFILVLIVNLALSLAICFGKKKFLFTKYYSNS
jgi:hypothetical protein